MQEITSATNPFVKQLRALNSSKKERQETQCFLIEGWRGIDTMLRHESRQYTLETLVVSPDWINDARLPEKIDKVLLSDHLFARISEVKNTQGILGMVRHTPAPFEYRADNGRYLLLDNLRDPGNLGTLIRSAVGAGFDGILLYGDCVDAQNPKVIRSTMGTFAFANLWNIGDDEIGGLLEHGYELYATTGGEAESLYGTKFGKRMVLAIGSEAHGLSETIMQRATQRITIPLSRECESLNAAIAGSICMFHIMLGN